MYTSLLIWKRYTNKLNNLALQNCRCELLHRFGLPCKHYLLRAFRQGQPIPRSLVHPRYWLRGPVIYSANWQPTYVEDEAEAYDELERPEMGSTGQQIMELRDQMKPEEKARYTRQIDEDQQKLLKIGQQHLKLQQLPIGNPSRVPKRQYKKKKIHGLADARGLTGAEIADKALKEREAKARRQATAQAIATHIGGDDEGIVTVPDTPPRALGESQGGTTISVDILAIRLSPEHRRAAIRPWVGPSPR
jgi:hypothetical protein